MSATLPELAHAGTCAIVGLPNVGKSTLLNRLLGVRLMAVSSKPQTTRNRVMGAVVREDEDLGKFQVVFVDTPGMQSGKGALRKYMRNEAMEAATSCDAALLMIDVSRKSQRSWRDLAEGPSGPMLQALEAFSGPRILGLNKVDTLEDKEELFAILDDFAAKDFASMVPISAKSGTGCEDLMRAIAKTLPAGPALFPDDMFTDRAERFLAAELIREQLFRQLGDELPYASAVVIESFQERDKGDVLIHAAIHVERDSQKGIVIGKGGGRIKSVGEKARKAISGLLGCPVHLKLFVKVNANWSQDQRSLKELGYEP